MWGPDRRSQFALGLWLRSPLQRQGINTWVTLIVAPASLDDLSKEIKSVSTSKSMPDRRTIFVYDSKGHNDRNTMGSPVRPFRLTPQFEAGRAHWTLLLREALNDK